MKMLEERNDENNIQLSKPSTEATEHKNNAKSNKKQILVHTNTTQISDQTIENEHDGKTSKQTAKERLSLKKSQEDKQEINGEESGKVRLSRQSLKAVAKSKFKECSQQGNLNSFVKVSSPKNSVDLEVDEFDSGGSVGVALKLSSNLFGTPKRDKIKNKSEGKRNKKKKNLLLADEQIETKSEIAAKTDEVTKMSLTNQNISEVDQIDSDLSSDNNFESKTESNLKNDNSGKLKMQYDSDSKITLSSESDSLVKLVNDSEVIEVANESLTSPKNNVFQFMMDQRHKSIGSNSPGKILESPPVVDETTVKDAKKKLQTRKLKFEKWNENKGAAQRKVDDAEKGVYIEKVLTKRKRRLKKMLTVQSDSEDEPKQTKKRKRNEKSESEDSLEVQPTKKKLPAPILLDEAADDEEIFNKHNKLAATQKVQTGLLNFFGVLKRETHERATVSDEECKENKTIKIKMFTPQAMKKRSKKKRSRKISSNDDSTPSTELKEIDNNSESSENVKLSTLKNRLSQKLDQPQTIDLTDDESSRESLRRSSRTRKVKNFIEDSEDFEEKKKEKKVAPIFLKSLPKPKLDPAVAQARLEFLHSGVPSLLKRVVEKQQQSLEEIEFDVFPSISHVQQRPDRLAMYWDLDDPELEVGEYPLYEPEELPLMSLGSLTNVYEEAEEAIALKPPVKLADKGCLEKIKSDNPDLPIFKIYRLLRERAEVTPKTEKKKRGRKKKGAEKPKEEVEGGAMWPEKYKPKLPDEIVGNRKSIKRFRSWLQNWIDYSQEKATKKTKRSENSDSDFESTDGDSRDTRLPSNMMILSGPFGCGKTATVYSVCNEMNINVIELNASSKRTGKKLLQEVQEATQSHQVRNKNIGLSAFVQKAEGSNKMCLLVIEDIDIVFEQDEGFISALSQLLSMSKRPVVLLTSDLNCPHVQKFVLHNNSLRFETISPGTSSVWLQVLCAAEGLHVDRSSIAQLLQCNKGDLRRTLLQLQFWVQTGGNPRAYITNYTTPTASLNDFAYQVDEPKIPERPDSEIHYFSSQNNKEISLGTLWWNLPQVFDSYDLERLSGVLETIATCDSLIKTNELEPCFKQWETDLTNGLSLSENMEGYKNCGLLDDLTQTLLQGHCKSYKTDCYTPAVPPFKMQSWRNERYNCEAVYSEAVPINYSTDRQAFAADYFPALRGISRVEAVRAKNNNKRGNRFYNYLKTLNFTPSSSAIKTACDILSVQNTLL